MSYCLLQCYTLHPKWNLCENILSNADDAALCEIQKQEETLWEHSGLFFSLFLAYVLSWTTASESLCM